MVNLFNIKRFIPIRALIQPFDTPYIFPSKMTRFFDPNGNLGGYFG